MWTLIYAFGIMWIFHVAMSMIDRRCKVREYADTWCIGTEEARDQLAARDAYLARRRANYRRRQAQATAQYRRQS